MKRFVGVAVVLALVLVACFKFPIGDRSAATADDRYAGIWLTSIDPASKSPGYETWLLAATDEHGYCIVKTYYSQDQSGRPQRGTSTVYYGWLTPVGEATLLSVRGLFTFLPEHRDASAYVVARLDLATDGSLTVRVLDDEYEPLKSASTTSELAALVRQNLSEQRMYKSTTALRRPSKDNKCELGIQTDLMVMGWQ